MSIPGATPEQEKWIRKYYYQVGDLFHLRNPDARIEPKPVSVWGGWVFWLVVAVVLALAWMIA